MIRRITLENCPDRYDRAQRHDHLVCGCCGELKDIELEDLTPFLEKGSGEEILSYDLKIRYLCPKCREKGGKG